MSEHVFCSVEKIGWIDHGHHKSIVHYGRLIQNNIKALCIVGLTRYLLLCQIIPQWTYSTSRYSKVHFNFDQWSLAFKQPFLIMKITFFCTKEIWLQFDSIRYCKLLQRFLGYLNHLLCWWSSTTTDNPVREDGSWL